jgi:hypothetical protein
MVRPNCVDKEEKKFDSVEKAIITNDQIVFIMRH